MRGGEVTIFIEYYSTIQRVGDVQTNDGQRAIDSGSIRYLADLNPGWWWRFGTSCWSLTVRSLECEGTQVSRGPASHGTFSSPTHQPNLIKRHLSINSQQFRVRHGSGSGASACCEAGPSSNFGSAPQRRPSTERKLWGKQELHSTSYILVPRLHLHQKEGLSVWLSTDPTLILHRTRLGSTETVYAINDHY